jgi:hypothetical protein
MKGVAAAAATDHVHAAITGHDTRSGAANSHAAGTAAVAAAVHDPTAAQDDDEFARAVAERWSRHRSKRVKRLLLMASQPSEYF